MPRTLLLLAAVTLGCAPVKHTHLTIHLVAMAKAAEIEDPEVAAIALREAVRAEVPGMLAALGRYVAELDALEESADREAQVAAIKARIKPNMERLQAAFNGLGKRADGNEAAETTLSALRAGPIGRLRMDLILKVGFDRISLPASDLCGRAFDHVIELFQKEFGDQPAMAPAIAKLTSASERQRALAQCKVAPIMELRCALAAKTMAELGKCSRGKTQPKKAEPEKSDPPKE